MIWWNFMKRKMKANFGSASPNYKGSSSFGVDLIYKGIKSTPNDEEPNNRKRQVFFPFPVALQKAGEQSTRPPFLPNHFILFSRNRPGVDPDPATYL
jgi:hypothetical protein